MLKEKFKEEINDYLIKNFDIVKNDKWRNKYHIMAPIGWINDPNGLCQINGNYHCYYQYSPLDPNGGLKFWGHYTSKDLVNWTDKGVAIYPDIAEDKDGVYSGSAFVKNDMIYFFYTGNVKLPGKHDYILTGREQNVILVTSKDGVNFSKKKVLLRNEDFPKDMTLHVRDPKVFEEDGLYYMALGARGVDDKGYVLLYKSDNLYDWEFHSVPAGGEENLGYMWECPDIFKLDNKEVFMFSPQGIKEDGYKYNNVYQSGYALGCFTQNKDNLELGDFVEIDRGFDFYAPQTFEDEKGRRIMIGWMGVPDADDHKNPTINNLWQHQLTIPRELILKEGKVEQRPIVELETLRKELVEIKETSFNENVALRIFESNTYELNLSFEETREFEILFRENCTISFKHKVFNLHLGHAGYGRDNRSVIIEQIKTIRIFSDNSSLEIFLNDGEEVFSTRIYNDKVDDTINVRSDGSVFIKRWNY